MAFGAGVLEVVPEVLLRFGSGLLDGFVEAGVVHGAVVVRISKMLGPEGIARAGGETDFVVERVRGYIRGRGV